MVKFLFDSNKCTLPYDHEVGSASGCLKCLEACPYGLLLLKPVGKPKNKPPKEPPEKYCIALTASYNFMADKVCKSCMKCQKVCPSDAIKII